MVRISLEQDEMTSGVTKDFSSLMQILVEVLVAVATLVIGIIGNSEIPTMTGDRTICTNLEIVFRPEEQGLVDMVEVHRILEGAIMIGRIIEDMRVLRVMIRGDLQDRLIITRTTGGSGASFCGGKSPVHKHLLFLSEDVRRGPPISVPGGYHRGADRSRSRSRERGGGYPQGGGGYGYDSRGGGYTSGYPPHGGRGGYSDSRGPPPGRFYDGPPPPEPRGGGGYDSRR
jgi:hypothetical protein